MKNKSNIIIDTGFIYALYCKRDLNHQKAKEAEWTNQYTLSEQDFRQLILEKMERNGLKTLIAEQRKIKEVD